MYKAIPKYMLPSILLRVRSTSNNASGNKRVIFSGITLYNGDNDLIIQTFNFIARSDAHTWLVVPDMDSRMTSSLVPRPFPPPVSHTVCKNGWGRPGRKSHVHDVR